MATFEAQQQAIERRRQLAQQLANQAMLPLQQPNVPGAKISPWEGVAKLVQALSGRIGANQADKQQSALSDAMQKAAREQAQQTAEAAVPPAEGDTAEVQSPVIPGYSQTFQIPPNILQDDKRKSTVTALANMLASQDPMMRQLGSYQYQNLLASKDKKDTRDAEMARALAGEKAANIRNENTIYGENQRQIGQQTFTGTQNDLNRALTASEGAADRKNRLDAMRPVVTPTDKEIDTFTSEDGFRVTTFQKPDGTMYEKKGTTKVQPAASNEYLNAIRAINLENATSAAPGQIVYKTSGNPVPPASLNDAATQKIADFKSLIGQADKVKGILDNLGSTGAIKGYVIREGIYIPIIQGQLSAQQAEAVSELQRLINSYIYAVSGKQINEQEFVRLQKTAPSLTYTPGANQVILKNFRDYAQKGMNNYLSLRGWKMKEEEKPAAGGGGFIVPGGALEKLLQGQ